MNIPKLSIIFVIANFYKVCYHELGGDFMRAYHENLKHNDIPFLSRIGTGGSFLAHWHTEIEITYVTNGSYLFGINDEHKVLHVGEFAIACSDDIHYRNSLTQSEERILLVFHPNIIDCPNGWPENLRFETPFITNDILEGIPVDVVERIDQLFRILPLELKQKKLNYQAYIKGLFFELTTLLLRHLATKPLTKKEKRRRSSKTKTLQCILEFLEANYMNEINIEDIATLLHISEPNLYRVFKDITGMTFNNFLNKFRLEKADNLLINTTDSITEIAMQCGFGSVRSFNRIYKIHKGYTPTFIR